MSIAVAAKLIGMLAEIMDNNPVVLVEKLSISVPTEAVKAAVIVKILGSVNLAFLFSLSSVVGSIYDFGNIIEIEIL